MKNYQFFILLSMMWIMNISINSSNLTIEIISMCVAMIVTGYGIYSGYIEIKLMHEKINEAKTNIKYLEKQKVFFNELTK